MHKYLANLSTITGKWVAMPEWNIIDHVGPRRIRQKLDCDNETADVIFSYIKAQSRQGKESLHDAWRRIHGVLYTMRRQEDTIGKIYTALKIEGCAEGLLDKATLGFVRDLGEERGSYLDAIIATRGAKALTGEKVIAFAYDGMYQRTIGQYFRTVASTGNVAAMTSDTMLGFLKKLNAATPDDYKMGGTHGGTKGEAAMKYLEVLHDAAMPGTLLERRVMDQAELICRLGARSEWYFRAILATNRVDALTSGGSALGTVASVGSETAGLLLKSIADTKDIGALTDRRMQDFIGWLGSAENRKEYLYAVSRVGGDGSLTSDRVIEFAKAVGGANAASYFATISNIGDFNILTSDAVLSNAGFFGSVGPHGAAKLFTALKAKSNQDILLAPAVRELAYALGEAFGDCVETLNAKGMMRLLDDSSLTNALRTVAGLDNGVANGAVAAYTKAIVSAVCRGGASDTLKGSGFLSLISSIEQHQVRMKILDAVSDGAALSTVMDASLASAAGFINRLEPEVGDRYLDAVIKTAQLQKLSGEDARSFILSLSTANRLQYLDDIIAANGSDVLLDSTTMASLSKLSGMGDEVLGRYLKVAGMRNRSALLSAPVLAMITEHMTPESATQYLGVLAKTKSPETILSPEFAAFFSSLKPEIASIYATLLREEHEYHMRYYAKTNKDAVMKFVLVEGGVMGTSGFMNEIGPRGAEAFLRLITYANHTTKETPKIIGKKVLDFALSIGGNIAAEYFNALKDATTNDDGVTNTYAWARLTNPAVLGNSDFIKSLGTNGARKYFDAAAKMKKTEMMANGKIMDSARALGEYADLYFTAMPKLEYWDTLTSDKTLSAMPLVGQVGARDAILAYLETLMEKGNVDTLTSEEVIGAVRRLGGAGAETIKAYLARYTAVENRSELLDPALLDYLRHLGHARSAEAAELVSTLIDDKKVLQFVNGLLRKEGERIKLLDDRALELFKYYGMLHQAGVDAENETVYMVRKGNKARITKHYRSVKNGAGNLSIDGLAVALDFVSAKMPSLGFTAEQRMEALDKLLQFAAISQNLSSDAFHRVSGVFYRRDLSDDELRNRYPEIMEYVDRHVGYAAGHPEFKAALSKDKVMDLLREYLGTEEPNIQTVKVEKQQVKKGKDAVIREKYESLFMSDLSRTVERSRYEALMDALSVHRHILARILDEDNPKAAYEVPDMMKPAIEGYTRLEANRGVMRDMLAKYYTDGPEKTQKWLMGLNGNTSVIAEMMARGTDVDAMQTFHVSYDSVAAQKLSRKWAERSEQIFQGIKEELARLGIGDISALGVDGGGSISETAEAVAKKLREMAAEGKLTKDAKRVVDGITNDANALKSFVGQMQLAGEAHRIEFAVPQDPMKRIQMGVGFESCLDIVNGSNNYGAVARTVDANNIVIFASEGDDEERVIGRVSLFETDKGLMVNSKFYENTTYDLFNPGGGWINALVELAARSGRELIVPTRFIKSPEAIKTLDAYGFKKENIEVKVSRAQCTSVYSDLGSQDLADTERYGYEVEAYVLGTKKAREASVGAANVQEAAEGASGSIRPVGLRT